MSFVFVLIPFPTISCCIQTKGTNGALWSIFGSVVGASPIVRYRVIYVGVVVAVAVGIAVASVPTTVGIYSSSNCCASSVGGGASFVDELAILLQQFINLRLLLVSLCLLFLHHLQQIIILHRHLLDVLFVGSCRYRYLTYIGFQASCLLASVLFCAGGTIKHMLEGIIALVPHCHVPSVLELSLKVDPHLFGYGFFFPSHQLLFGEHI